ncbi:MAG: MBG domain-containing protein, partial [Chitinophagaceae bacterium]
MTSQNYSLNLFPGTLTILPATVVVTAEDKTIVYGEEWPAFTYYYQGFRNGETEFTAGITGRTTATLASTIADGAGTYPIVFSDTSLQAPHYRFVYQTGVLTIRKASLFVQPRNYSRVYGEPDPEFAVDLSGFVKGEDLSSSRITGQPILKSSATQDSGAGDYKISALLGTLTAPNYAFILGTGSLQIVKAPLTVIPRDTLRPYGGADPAFDYTFSGFVNGDDRLSSGITGRPLLTSAATAASLPGHYSITGSQGTLRSNKYYFQLQSGDLWITKARLLAKVNAATRAVGAADPDFSYTLSGFVNGEDAASAEVSGSPIITSTALSNDPAGIYPIEISAGDLSAPNYDMDVENGLLYVFKAQIITRDTLSCQGQTTELKLDTAYLLAGYPYQIHWSTGDTTNTIHVAPRERQNYSVILSDTKKESADSVTLTPSVVDTSLAIIGYTPGCNTQGEVRLQAGEAKTYQWLWNGQPVAQANTREWVSAQSGTYQVIVTNEWGCVDTSRAITIAFSPLPKADFTLNTAQQCRLGNLVVATNSSSLSQGTLKFVWNFGDGEQDSTLNASHSYADTGVYAIQLVATSEAGCQDSITRWVSIRPNPVVTVNSGSICQGASIPLNAQGADTYTWSPTSGLNAVTGSTVI